MFPRQKEMIFALALDGFSDFFQDAGVVSIVVGALFVLLCAAGGIETAWFKLPLGKAGRIVLLLVGVPIAGVGIYAKLLQPPHAASSVYVPSDKKQDDLQIASRHRDSSRSSHTSAFVPHLSARDIIIGLYPTVKMDSPDGYEITIVGSPKVITDVFLKFPNLLSSIA
jgi:hypothetical protein